MVKSIYVKSKFTQLNDKRFYFPDEIVSLSFYRLILSKINEIKQKKARKLKNIFGKKIAFGSPRKRGIKKPP